MNTAFTVGQVVKIAHPSKAWASNYGCIERIDGQYIYVRVAVDHNNPTAWDTIQFHASELRPDQRN